MKGTDKSSRNGTDIVVCVVGLGLQSKARNTVSFCLQYLPPWNILFLTYLSVVFYPSGNSSTFSKLF